MRRARPAKGGARLLLCRRSRSHDLNNERRPGFADDTNRSQQQYVSKNWSLVMRVGIGADDGAGACGPKAHCFPPGHDLNDRFRQLGCGPGTRFRARGSGRAIPLGDGQFARRLCRIRRGRHKSQLHDQTRQQLHYRREQLQPHSRFYPDGVN